MPGTENVAANRRRGASVARALGFAMFCAGVVAAGAWASFSPKVDYPLGGAPVGVATGDFDRDGDNDLAVVNSDSETLQILDAAGNGTFALEDDYGLGFNPSAVIAARLDGDRRL